MREYMRRQRAAKAAALARRMGKLLIAAVLMLVASEDAIAQVHPNLTCAGTLITTTDKKVLWFVDNRVQVGSPSS
jgi:hypothetical protein